MHSGEGRKSGQVPGRRGPSHIRAKYSRLGATCVNMEQIMNPLTGGYYARKRLPATMDLEGTRPLELLPEQSVTSTLWEECPCVCVCVYTCVQISPSTAPINKLGCCNHNFLASFSV